MCCAAGIFCGGNRIAQSSLVPFQEKTTVTGEKKMDLTPFRLDDAAFWAGNDRSKDPILRKLLGEYSGLAVDAPRRVPIDERKTLPAGLYYFGAIAEVHAVPLMRHGVITAMNLAENQLYVARARDLRRDAIQQPSMDPSALPPGEVGIAESAEMRDLLGLPWQPARLLLTILLRNKVSNRVLVELRRSEGAYRDPEVIKLEQAKLAKRNPPPMYPQPGKDLPSYAKLQESPALPAEPGITMAQTRLVELKSDPRCPLYGAFRLPVLPQEIVKSDYADPYLEAHPREPKPSAVVRITLLATGADDGFVFAWALNVPSYDRMPGSSDPQNPPMATGYFSLDLLQMSGMPRTPQTYFIYAFSGEIMTDPLPCALVAAEK
jgi:hypothetical protein